MSQLRTDHAGPALAPTDLKAPYVPCQYFPGEFTSLITIVIIYIRKKLLNWHLHRYAHLV